MRGEIMLRSVVVGLSRLAAAARERQRRATIAIELVDGVLEPVVDDDVRELVLGGELLARRRAGARSTSLGVVGAAADQPRAQRLDATAAR